MSLNQLIEEFLLENGAIKVRFANLESLAGCPPSADLTYQIEGARSAVSFALALDRDRTRRYLAKEAYHEEIISGKWSTWSPGRLHIPEKPEETVTFLAKAFAQYCKRPDIPREGGYTSREIGGNVNLRIACGNCFFICFGDRDETLENYRLLTSSGCVIQLENGEKVVLPPEEAAEEFEKLNPDHKKLYT